MALYSPKKLCTEKFFKVRPQILKEVWP